MYIYVKAFMKHASSYDLVHICLDNYMPLQDKGYVVVTL